ncbi:hypothetical protein CYMTET_24948 [Cymbomonas tetramitiformis]|uniref:Uncharacterized protein n=1 Tax=Cymbomonas tetramitiformis TaxID=36881 RepID=A0AAE0C1C3_9CHLO|nr:hypothetical protein CYMTET_44729 [Cymbomonas tetramitiformis]KAK3266427.1 hypothetical protein CYMTET_24948 [Cymbomonas tetramitiformis]
MNPSEDRKRPQKTATATPLKSSATTRTSAKAAASGPAKDAVASPAKSEPTKAKPHPLPSARLRVATSSPFAKKGEGKTPFTVIYNGGGIPCRINHGTARCYLQWNKPPTELPYDPLLLHCAEGIRETTHPQNFVARTAFQELLAAEVRADSPVLVAGIWG